VPAKAPALTEEVKEQEPLENHKFTKNEWIFCLQNFLMAVCIIIAVSLNNLRTSSYVIDKNIGTSVDGANILGIAVFVGFLGGLAFGKLFQILKERLILLVFLIMTAVGLCLMVAATNIPVMAIGSSICSASTTIFISALFNRISDHLPKSALTTANSITLVGCNLGATITPFVLSLIETVNPSMASSFLTVSAAFVALTILMLLAGCKRAVSK